jgi:hypothetical protein
MIVPCLGPDSDRGGSARADCAPSNCSVGSTVVWGVMGVPSTVCVVAVSGGPEPCAACMSVAACGEALGAMAPITIRCIRDSVGAATPAPSVIAMMGALIGGSAPTSGRRDCTTSGIPGAIDNVTTGVGYPDDGSTGVGYPDDGSTGVGYLDDGSTGVRYLLKDPLVSDTPMMVRPMSSCAMTVRLARRRSAVSKGEATPTMTLPAL